MMRIGVRLAVATCGIAMLAVAVGSVFGFQSAAAQSPDTRTQPCCWDRWNPNWMQRDMWGPGQMGPGMRQRMVRHWTFMHQGIPAEYRAARNPLSPDAKTISEGHTLYQENCVSCHGATGMGDGEIANSLNPSPALLAYMIQMPMAVDEYMFWSVSEGGDAFGTGMPAYKEVLTEDEIWKIITYMRAGFPAEQAQQ